MKKIPLNHGLHALVDDEDFAMLQNYEWIAVQENPLFLKTKCNEKWSPCTFTEGGFGKAKKVKMTRLIMGIGQPHQSNFVVQHIDGDTLDCRKENLILKTRKDIAFEASKIAAEKAAKKKRNLWD